MRNDTEPAEAGKRYTAAHLAHYTTKDLVEALGLYRDIIATYPDTREAGYSQSQIQNIVNAVVPKQEIFDAQVDLVLAIFAHDDSVDVTLAPVTP